MSLDRAESIHDNPRLSRLRNKTAPISEIILSRIKLADEVHVDPRAGYRKAYEFDRNRGPIREHRRGGSSFSYGSFRCFENHLRLMSGQNSLPTCDNASVAS
jgi:hypothetical protein